MRYHLLLVILTATGDPALATHVIGAEIRYEHQEGLVYRITGILYQNLSAPADRPWIFMGVGGALDTIFRINMEDDPLIGCGGTRRSTYQFDHTFPGPGSYTVQLSDDYRTAGIINIQGSVSTPICVTALLNITPSLGPNNSIRFETSMSQLDQTWNVFTHDPGAYDQDGIASPLS